MIANHIRAWRIRRLETRLAGVVAQDQAARAVYEAVGSCSPVFLIQLAGRMGELRSRIAQLKEKS